MTDGVTLGCNATRGFAVKTTLIHRCEILAAAMDQPSCEMMKTLISAFELNETTLKCPLKKQQFVLLFFFFKQNIDSGFQQFFFSKVSQRLRVTGWN